MRPEPNTPPTWFWNAYRMHGESLQPWRPLRFHVHRYYSGGQQINATSWVYSIETAHTLYRTLLIEILGTWRIAIGTRITSVPLDASPEPHA